MRVVHPEQGNSTKTQEEFTLRYTDYPHDARTIAVLTEPQQFRDLLESIITTTPIVHPSCIDDGQSTCVHYYDQDRVRHVAALYNYRMVQKEELVSRKRARGLKLPPKRVTKHINEPLNIFYGV